jgi:hypothetical protein
MHLRRVGGVLAACTVLACGGDTVSPKPLPSLKIVSGAIATDTVLAVASDLLRVEVRDSSGQLAPGVAVQFRVPLPAGESDPRMRGAYACDTRNSVCANVTPTSSTVAPQVDTYSDASGIASARVQHGMRATTGVIEISAPSLNMSTSATYTTLPGALVSFAVTEADTSVYVGRSYPLSAHTLDRFGNARADAVTIEALTPAVATFANGQVTANAIGRGSFALHAGAFVQTAYVSVPPPGRLVASGVSQYPRLGLVLLDTDGGSRRTLATTTGHVGFAFPAWHGDGRRVVALESGADGRARIIAYDTASSARTALVDTVEFPESLEPSYPRSGTSVYFYGIRRGSERGVYRAAIDGSGAQLVISDPAFGIVSPDESVLLIGTAAGVVKRDLATGQEQVIAATNYAPFWSPAGDLIGYRATNGGNTLDLHVVRPDGSGDRLVSAGMYDATSFSPDGEWIATTRGNVGVELVRVSDGLRLPVGGTRTFNQVAWRRE